VKLPDIFQSATSFGMLTHPPWEGN